MKQLELICMRIWSLFQQFDNTVELCRVVQDLAHKSDDIKEAAVIKEINYITQLIVKLLSDSKHSIELTVNLVDVKERCKKLQTVHCKLSKNTRMALSMVPSICESAIGCYDDFLKDIKVYYKLSLADKSIDIYDTIKKIVTKADL